MSRITAMLIATVTLLSASTISFSQPYCFFIQEVVPQRTTIRLDTPSSFELLNNGELDVDSIKDTIVSKLSNVQVSQPQEVSGKTSFTAEDIQKQSIREYIERNIPIGFGPLRKTNLSIKRPILSEENDDRIITIEKQPFNERLIGRTNLLPVNFLEAGTVAARSVGRIAIKYNAVPEAGIGTGFLISKDLMMTNNHVIPTVAFAKKVVIQFNYQYTLDGSSIIPPDSYELDPDDFFLTNSVSALDFTIVRVRPFARPTTLNDSTLKKNDSDPTVYPGDRYGFISLSNNFLYSVGQLANIIQHPLGQPKQIAIHEGNLVAVHENHLSYTTDTEPGSSGSPVFNNRWQIIALHHSAGSRDTTTHQWTSNEGIRIDKIIAFLNKNLSEKQRAEINTR